MTAGNGNFKSKVCAAPSFPLFESRGGKTKGECWKESLLECHPMRHWPRKKGKETLMHFYTYKFCLTFVTACFLLFLSWNFKKILCEVGILFYLQCARISFFIWGCNCCQDFLFFRLYKMYCMHGKMFRDGLIIFNLKSLRKKQVS